MNEEKLLNLSEKFQGINISPEKILKMLFLHLQSEEIQHKTDLRKKRIEVDEINFLIRLEEIEKKNIFMLYIVGLKGVEMVTVISKVNISEKIDKILELWRLEKYEEIISVFLPSVSIDELVNQIQNEGI